MISLPAGVMAGSVSTTCPRFGGGLFSLSQDLILAMVPEIIFWGTN